MSSEAVIAVRNVSKKFRLFSSAKERLTEALHPFRRRYHREFWALRDVSFEVSRGETLGILGRNGSGKSTLLQIICAVMRPTSGQVYVNGRIAAMLELGAGFNPEFTGRENALLNGAIMGIPRKEMVKRLSDIEAFADIGTFFDQPVKTYSSGMYARLAFACSINVDPDILVVDESLSVGDAKFQNKCFMHFKRLQAEGKTILLVSHSTEAILRQCTRALLINDGRLIMQGDPQSVVDRYYELLFPSNYKQQGLRRHLDGQDCLDGAASMPQDGRAMLYPSELTTVSAVCEQRNSYNKNEFRFGDREVEVADYILVGDGKVFPMEVQSGATMSLYVRLRVNQFNGRLSAGFAVKTVDGIKLFGANTMSSGVSLPPAHPGESLWVRFDFMLNVGPGDVFFDLGCGDWTAPPARPLDRRHSVIHLVVTADGRFDGVANCFVKVSVVNEVGAQGVGLAQSVNAQ
jgi:lipopolysaccharide transport system ATP-binding protein